VNHQDAWGRWGAEDERGAVNMIGPNEVRRAAGLIKSGHVIPLGQPISPKTPVPPHRAPMQHFMNRDGGDYAAGGKRPGGFQFGEDTVVMPLQFATHVDALCHAWCDDQLYNGFSSTGTRSTTRATRCGVEKMGTIVTRGVCSISRSMLAALPVGRDSFACHAGDGGGARWRCDRCLRCGADPHRLDRDDARGSSLR
jgi:hypothetical protein